MKSFINKYFVCLPVVYLFVTVFLLRSDVRYFYLSSVIMLAIAGIFIRNKRATSDVWLARWLLMLAAVGIVASVILAIEKVELLTEPAHIASCSLSPVVACSPVITSPQASAFGFPNPFIGLFGFTAVFTAAMTILAGATRLAKAWWRTLLAGIVFGSGFSVWLFHEGVFDIGKLCLYCMAVWLVTFAMLWLVLAHAIQNKYIKLGTKLNTLFSSKFKLIALTYVTIFLIILYRWSDYWFR